MDSDSNQSAWRNAALYQWYSAVFNAHFWMPIFVLYFLQHMSLSSVLALEAVYYAGIVLLEVPSGYFSDRFGRRLTLMISNVSLVIAYSVFLFGDSFAEFAVAQILLAAGLAFNSGTDTSLHYDSLASIDREDEFDWREAKAARNGLLASGAAGLIGGIAGVFDLRLAYALSCGTALAGLVIVLLMREPASHEKRLVAMGPVAQVKTCAAYLGQPTLRWLFAFFVVMTVLNHVPYEFYQPYIALTLPESLLPGNEAPIVTGVHMAIVMLIAAWFAARSIQLRDKLGLRGVLLSAGVLQTIIILSMGLLLHPLVAVLCLLRSVPRALMAAPMNAAIAPRVQQTQRATYLSIQSLAGRLAFSAWLLILAVVPIGQAGEGSWGALSNRLLLSAAIGLIALTCLWLFRSEKAGVSD